MRPTRDLVFAEMACSTGPRLQPTAYFGHARSLPTENLLYFDFAVVSRNVIRCALEGNWTLDVFLSALWYSNSTIFQKDWLVIRGSLGGAKTAVAPLSIRSFEYLLYNRPLVVFTLATPLYLPSTVNLWTVQPSPIDIPCANIAHPNVCVCHQRYALKFLHTMNNALMV